MKPKIISFVAGKSGGHIIPCLTIAITMQAQDTHTRILFFSSNTDIDKKILSNNPNVSWHIMLPLSTKAQSFFVTIWHTIISFMRSFFYLCKHRPEEIITTGGIVAIPSCIAAYLLRIPITIYSLDAVPGKAIRFLTPLATSIYVCFAESQKYYPTYKCVIRPYPMKYGNAAPFQHKEVALSNLGLSAYKKTIVILGGSQGSLFLNQCIENLIKNRSLDGEQFQVVHQTGSIDTKNWLQFYQENNIIAYVFSYMPNLESVYIAADLIICRAGAGTLFEVKHFNKKCIIIPLETNTTTHQVDNALAMSTEYPLLFFTIKQSKIENNNNALHEVINKLLF